MGSQMKARQMQNKTSCFQNDHEKSLQGNSSSSISCQQTGNAGGTNFPIYRESKLRKPFSSKFLYLFQPGKRQNDRK